jgi:hypothetical protein
MDQSCDQGRVVVFQDLRLVPVNGDKLTGNLLGALLFIPG